jgi:hypothetical protein
MLSRLKSYVWVVLAAGAFYFLLSHHFIFFSLGDFNLLKKKKLTFKYTFYSIMQHTPYETLHIKELREDGIENIMLDRGMLSEQQLDGILEKIDSLQ